MHGPLVLLATLVFSQSANGLLSHWLKRVSNVALTAPGGGFDVGGGGGLWGWAWGADNILTVVDRDPAVSFLARPASFGPVVEDRLIGYAIPLNAFTVPCNQTQDPEDGRAGVSKPNLGCSELCVVGDHYPHKNESWVAVVQRGGCQFVDKVREAKRLGAKAVVVGGDDPAVSGNPDVLVSMYSPVDARDVDIPSTFIKFSDYLQLFNLIEESNTTTSGIRTVSLQIVTDLSSWDWYSPIITFIILLILPSVLTLLTLLIHRMRAARAARRERAPEDIVKNLPWLIWTKNGWEKHDSDANPSTPAASDDSLDLERGENAETSHAHDDGVKQQNHQKVQSHHPWFEDHQTECAICLSEFVVGDRVRVLPCKHIFHLDEVDSWLTQRKKLCPVCKADVTRPPSASKAKNTNQNESQSNQAAPVVRVANSAAHATERTPLLYSGRTSLNNNALVDEQQQS